jgi:hypothetical protein
VPLDCFPPGYPLLTAGLMCLGVDDAYTAAKTVAAGCSCVFVFLVLAFYARKLPPLIAGLLGMGFVCTAPMLVYESMCLSEAPYMLLATISVLCLLKGTADADAAKWWILVAGLAGGYAWCVRNVGVALFLASLCYLASRLPRLRFHGLATAAGVWLTGWFLASGWLVVRNLWTFDTANPYHAPPMRLSFWPIALVAAIAIAAVVSARKLSWRKLAVLIQDRPDVCLLGAFLLFHVLVVVAAHCVYRLAESAQSARFYVPGYWIGLWLLVLCGRRLGARLPLKPRTAHAILAATLAVFAVSQAVGPLLVTFLEQRAPVCAARTEEPSRHDVALLAKNIPKDRLVLSDSVQELQVFGNVNARHVPDIEFGEAPVTWREIDEAGKDGRLWGLVVWNEEQFAQGRYGDALREVVLNPDKFQQLRKLESAKGVLVWQFVR